MTAVASSHGLTEVISARRTESIDAPAILDLVAERTHEQFGRVNIVHLIEKANLSVTLSNEENEVLGFAGFLDHPQIEVCDPASWEIWMQETKYSLSSKATPLNSLFLHYFTAKDDYTIGCASEIVRTVFNAVPELRFVFLTLRSDLELEPALAEIFQAVEKQGPGGHHTLYVCHRHRHVPLLHIRKAVVEDHDDLVPIFKRLNNNLIEEYGNYFLAETIEAQDEHNHCLVAEVGGKAIGFMSICDQVNVDVLQSCFELDSFHGLCEPHPEDVLEEEKLQNEEEASAVGQNQPNPNPSSSSASAETRDQQSTASLRSASELNLVKEPHSSASVTVEPVPVTPAHSVTSVTTATNTNQAKLSELHMTGSSSSLLQETSPQENEEEKVEEEEEEEEEEEVFLTPISTASSSETRSNFVPTYRGDPSAFSIQLFCIDEQYEMRSADFLPQIFKLFPHKNIAVITVPHLVPEFPLIQQFVRITPKPSSNPPHELYAFHRHGLIVNNFKVRPACTKDYDQVVKLVSKIEMKDNLLADLHRFNSARRDADGTEIQAFVADCLDQVVGICIVRREESVEYIRSHYNIEDFIYFNHHRRDEHTHLHHFALNPIFQHHSKHFMKEVLRQSHKSCIYYPVFPRYASSSNHSLITGLNFLVPVRARRQIVYPVQELGINAPSDRVMAEALPYALNHINRKLTLEPKVTINARIVVVGASDLALAFLEYMCFCPHLRFNNITLISKGGLPNTLRSNSGTYSSEDLARLSLRSWVNSVQGVMTVIDRSRKQVVLSDDSRVSYDHLILCAGQQYQIPAPSGADVDNMATNHDLPKSAVLRAHDINLPTPENVMAFNDDEDAKRLATWATRLGSKMDPTIDRDIPSIVVYGRTFDTYAAIQLLLSRGVPGARIILVRPPAHNSPVSVCDDGCGDPFNEPVVTQAVMKALEEAEVRCLSDHVLARWNVEPTELGTRITSVAFTTPSKPVVFLPCAGLISLHPRKIDTRTFQACNDACLVFDGRLTIDASFTTNDPSIRAAGPLTKYARRYHADGFWARHENHSAREIGFRLALSVLPLFDPTLDGGNVPPPPITPVTPKPATPATSFAENPHEKLVPVFAEAKVTSGELPGGYQYLHVRKPGERAPFAAQLDNPEHGRELVTGSLERGNYFRLHINQYRRVETITCMVLEDSVELPTSNIIRLYGIHERCLNNLVSRFDEGLITDFYAFFREPWCLAIFHDRFQDFTHEVRELLGSTPPGAVNLVSIETRARQLVEEDLTIAFQQRLALRDHYQLVGQRKAVEARLLSYLSYNYYHLSMYAKPGMV